MSAPPNFARVCEALFSSMGWSFVINIVFQYSLNTKSTDERWGRGWTYLKGTGLLDNLCYLITLLYFNCTVHSLIRNI